MPNWVRNALAEAVSQMASHIGVEMPVDRNLTLSPDGRLGKGLSAIVRALCVTVGEMSA